MNPLRATLLAVAYVGVALFSPTSFAQRVEVIERGPHHAVVQAILPDGTTNQFTQLQTGLNRRSEVDGQYIPVTTRTRSLSKMICSSSWTRLLPVSRPTPSTGSTSPSTCATRWTASFRAAR